ncbi:hypothetical protein JQC92_09285 [Shewanella sp. 202IG2-18]|uniref:hypothetical protein n=1 Tax=Parashewanella hymeniacidonis TaxID=2807618 RepID=UPI00196033B9|nr:hypothetical protein [Parashewanella hymeniacidonis]MBM7072218.1 hypothetical protein [Parashewanella hymeniacidonis]
MASAAGSSLSGTPTGYETSVTKEQSLPARDNQSDTLSRLELAAKTVFEAGSKNLTLLSNVAKALQQLNSAQLTDVPNGSDSLSLKQERLTQLLNDTTIDIKIKEQALKQFAVVDVLFLPFRIDRAIIILNASNVRQAVHMTHVYQLMDSRSLDLFVEYQSQIPKEKKTVETGRDEWALVHKDASVPLTGYDQYREERISPAYFSIRYARYLLTNARGSNADEINVQDIKDAIGEEEFQKICSKIQSKTPGEVTLGEVIKVLNSDILASKIASHMCPIDSIHISTTTSEDVKVHSNHKVTVKRDGKSTPIKPSDLIKINFSNLPPHIRSLIIEKAFSNSTADSKESILTVIDRLDLLSKQFKPDELYKIDLKRKCIDALNDPTSSNSEQFVAFISELDSMYARQILPLLKVPKERAKCIEVMLSKGSHLTDHKSVIDEKLIHLIVPEVLEMCPQKVVLASLEAICKHKPTECSTKAAKILLNLKLKDSPQCYSDAVFFAAANGNHEVLEALYCIPKLATTVRKNERFYEGYPELAAIKHNQLECLQIILKATDVSLADARYPFKDGTLFYCAARSEDTKCLQYLLEQPSTEFSSLVPVHNKFLVELGKVITSNAIKLIAKYPAFRNLTEGQRAAMYRGVADRFRYDSEENQCLRNCKSRQDQVTPYYHTKSKDEINNLPYREKRAAFVGLIKANDLKRLRWLVESVKPRKLSKEVGLPQIVDALFIIETSNLNTIEIIKILENEGFDIFDKRKPLIMSACVRSSREVVAFLYARYKESNRLQGLFNLRNIYGKGLAHLTVSENNIGALTALLKCDSRFAETRLSIPRSRNHNVDDACWKQIKACAGDTPLMAAARMTPCNEQILQLLINHSEGVLFSTSSQEMDAFAIAVDNNNIEAARVFKEEYEKECVRSRTNAAGIKMSETRVVGLLDTKSTWHLYNSKSDFSEMKRILADMIQRHATQRGDARNTSSTNKTKPKSVTSAPENLSKPAALDPGSFPLQDLKK